MTKLITRTGRVQNWIDSPKGRLPVSCTVFVVDDSMEGPEGIEESWRFVSHALRYGAGCAVHLSKIRPRGQKNADGLVASGPVSFAHVYSTLNEILRRGGHYKNGAVVCHLDYRHPDLEEFITAPRHKLAWVKRCVDVDSMFIEDLRNRNLLEALLQGIRSGDIWLNKIRFNSQGRRIYGNVCLEVYLPSRGTCLLQHVNLGACTLDQIPMAFTEGMESLCKLHSRTGVDSSGQYLSPSEDRQVGLGVLGLANLLAAEGISYSQFGDALRRKELTPDSESNSHADKLVDQLRTGIRLATEIANSYSMERSFCIAPTATCSYKSVDRFGYACAPEIAPPISDYVERDSETFGTQVFEYGPVETAIDVGWEDYKRVANSVVRLFQQTGLFHGYSYNWWSDVVAMDEPFLEDWLNGPQTSLYYALQVTSDVQDKTDAMLALGEFDEFFKSEECKLDDAGQCSACAE